MKTTSLFIAGLSFGSFFKPLKALAEVPAGKTACTTADPVANALGYVDDAKNIDKKKYPQFKTIKKDQNCKGCNLYNASSGGFGQCTMIANCVVAEKGLCGSWQKDTRKKKA